MKFWDLLRTANSNLWRNKLRTTLTIIAIFVGGFVITLMVGVNAGVNDYINQQIGGIGGDNLIIAMAKQETRGENTGGPQKYDPNTTTSSETGNTFKMLTSSDITEIAKIDSRIVSVTPDLSPSATWISGKNGEKYVMSVGQQVPGLNTSMASGKVPELDSADNEIVLQTDEISALGFKDSQDAIGKTIEIGVKQPNSEIKSVVANIVGVKNKTLANDGGQNIINRTLAKNMSDVQMAGIQNRPDQYVRASVMVKDGLTGDEITSLRDKISNGGFYAVSIRDQLGTITSVVNAITTTLIGFGAIALLAASFGIINTLFMSVQERTKEIGLMKAMGMSRRKVFGLFSLEAALIGFWGSSVSIIAAIGAGDIINSISKATFLKDLDGFNLIIFQPAGLISVVVVIMLIAFLSGTLPARRASKKDPIEALRYE